MQTVPRHKAWHALQVYTIRFLPLPLRVKERLVWLLSPRYRLGVHAVVTDAAGRVLTLHSSYSGRWQLPGGTVDFGESFDTAMRREGFEELGLAFAALERVGTCSDATGRQLHAIYRAVLMPGSIQLSVEHRRWRFQQASKLSPFYRAIVCQALDPTGGEVRLPG
ncbi:MAG TPA: NUDIX domain-containing protein [Dehalococcoidia bacterium]|nr:NUDIX domain-containing protein [Dehalococcoidia bacterium]